MVKLKSSSKIQNEESDVGTKGNKIKPASTGYRFNKGSLTLQEAIVDI